MVDVFIRIVNMSVTASVIALLLTLLRLLLKKHLPPTFCYLLWGAVFFRLLVPISFPAIFSLFNLAHNRLVPTHTQGYVVTMDYVESGYVPVPSTDTYTLFVVLTAVWLTVAALLLLYVVVINLCIRHKVQTAFLLHEQQEVLEECRRLTGTKAVVRLYHSLDFETPVVVGSLRPRIILPSFIDLQNRPMLLHIITHELIHIRRWDMVTKKLAALALIIHWFNPLVWLCCMQLDRDIETSCDEEALSRMGEQSRTGYAKSLVELCARSRNFWSTSALSFGETAIKTRVASAINYHRLSRVKTVVLYTLVVAIGLITSTNPVSVSDGYIPTRSQITGVAQAEFEDTALLLSDILAEGDVRKLLSICYDNDAHYLELYTRLAEDPVVVESYKLYPQSERLAYCYMKVDEKERYVAELTRSKGKTMLTRLSSAAAFEAAMAVEETEPVRFIRNLHRFGIYAGLNSGDSLPRPAVTALCIDEEYRDRVKTGEHDPANEYLPPAWITQAAEEYFNLIDFSYTFDEELYSSERQMYIYDPSRGGIPRAEVVAVKQQGSSTIVTAQLYRDSLFLYPDCTVTYTLQKKR